MSVQTITFAYNKQRIAEFVAENLEFTRQPEGLLITAEGEMVAQDTPSVETLINHKSTCHVTICKDGQTIIEQPFEVTFFTLEADELVALLQ